MILHLKPLLFRVSFLIIAMLMSVSPVVMATEATVSGGISVHNEGSLSVTLSDGEVTFVTESGGPAQITASTGDVQYARIQIVISDDRAESAREPYSISHRLTSLQIPESPFIIDASNISFIQATNLPNGLTQAWAGEAGVAQSGNQETAIIRSSEVPPAGTYTVTVQVRMGVPAGTVPGNYTGRVLLSLNPVFDP